MDRGQMEEVQRIEKTWSGSEPFESETTQNAKKGVKREPRRSEPKKPLYHC